MYDGGLNLDLSDFQRLMNKTDFEEEPVDLDTFCSDEYFLGMRNKDGSPQVVGLQKEIIDRMSQIYMLPTLVELHGEREGKRLWDRTVNEVIAQLGKGSGKDYSIRVAFCRIIYLLHCLRDPLAYYDKGKGDFIDLLNLALNADQAKNVFFDPMKNLLGQSPYFQDKGMEFRSKEIYFLSRPIRCFSGHSGAEGWEGYNLIAVVLDEIAAFKTQSELGGEKNRYSADTLYNMANNSVISRFPDIGKIALLSFPRYQGDYIQEKYEACISSKKIHKITQVIGTHEGEDVSVSWQEDEIQSYAIPKVWALKAPSFRVNPQRHIEDYLSSYISNPVETLARFFCMPPEMQSAYFRDPDRVRICFPEDESLNPVDEFGRFKEWFKEDDMEDGSKRYVHIDLGLNRDRAGLSMVHAIGSKTVSHFDGILTTSHKLPVIKMDIIHYWEAPPGGEIDFNDIRQFIFNLADRFPIILVSMDRWNSQDTSKILQSRGLATEMHTVDKEDYDTLSTSIYDARLVAYHDEILVEQELLKLQLLKGKKVDHPSCLVGETRIPLLDGTYPMIKYMVGKESEVYSADSDGLVHRGKATAILSGHVEKVVDVVLDNGYTVRCTLDHPFMLNDGSYKEAQYLTIDDRLMAIHRSFMNRGGWADYETIIDSRSRRYLTHHRVFEDVHGEKSSDEIIHHIDHNKLNNSSSNLVNMTRGQHQNHHASHSYDQKREALVAGVVKFNQLEATKDMRRQFMNSQTKKWHLDRADKNPNKRKDIDFSSLQKVSECINAFSASKKLNCGRNVVMRVLRENDFNSWEEFRFSQTQNHRVRLVEVVQLDESIPIYDLQVADWHNFLLPGGVFVHNTGFKDGSDCLAGAVWYCTQWTPIEEEMDIDVLGSSDEDERDPDERTLSNTPAKRLPSKKAEMPEDISEFLARMRAI